VAEDNAVVSDPMGFTPQDGPSVADRRCNHPRAVAIDPTNRDLRELEAMLARCPNCNRWTPGDGPIMATLHGPGVADNEDSKNPSPVPRSEAPDHETRLRDKRPAARFTFSNDEETTWKP
jgi:hypothetical protein